MSEARVLASSLTVRAAAKINLHLGVGAPRPDGFHPLVTVYQALGLYDDVTATVSPGNSVEVTGEPHIDVVGVPLIGNIVEAAANELEVTAHFDIHKAIPVAGGMAGGSADAAAALVALDRLFDLNTPDEELLAIAARLGSDVPFALVGGTALGTGRGEVVEDVSDEGIWWWVAVPSEQGGLSTPAVYRRYDEMRPDAPSEPAGADDVLSALASGDPAELAAALHNDLQIAALDLRPDLASVIEFGEAAGALRGIVSGSGPTCVFLTDSSDAAREVTAAFQEEGHIALPAPAPVAGATLVDYA